jgi:hypothetical protein
MYDDYEKKVLSILVNNSTNINKSNNHISPQLNEHKKTVIYDVGNPCPGLGEAQSITNF